MANCLPLFVAGGAIVNLTRKQQRQDDRRQQAERLEREAFGAGILAATKHFHSAIKMATDFDPQEEWLDYRGQNDRR